MLLRLIPIFLFILITVHPAMGIEVRAVGHEPVSATRIERIDDQIIVHTGEADQAETQSIPIADVITIEFAKPIESLPRANDWLTTLTDRRTLVGVMKQWDAQAGILSFDLNTPKVMSTLSIPRTQIAELWRPPKHMAHPLKPDRTHESDKFDTVYVVDNDKTWRNAEQLKSINGQIVAVEDQTLIFQYKGKDRRINLDRVVGLVFGGAEIQRDNTLSHQVTLQGGGQLEGVWQQITDQTMTLQTRWGQTVELPTEIILRLDTLNGRLIDLTQLQPASIEQTPYFNRMISYQINQSLAGGPLTLMDGTQPATGLAMHSRTILRFDLDAQFQRFTASVVMSQESSLGHVAVVVRGDDRILWEDQSFTAASGVVPLDLDVSQVKSLAIEVDFGQGQDVGDRVVWAEPKLLRQLSTE